MSESRGSTDDQAADTTTLQSRSGPEHLSLSRCAACYNVKSSSVSWRGDNGESSSSAEDSGPEVDDESEAESSSSSSSGNETPEPERSGDAAEDESRGGGGERGEDGDEMGETSNRQEEKNKPSSLTPRLIPLSFLPRPPQVVSTLHLQVFPQNCGDDETFFNIRQRRPEREEEETQESYTGRGGGGRGSINRLMPQQLPQGQQMMLPWQQRSQPTEQHHHHHHQRPKPRQLSAQGQRLPPPSHTRPPTLCTPLWAPHTHLHALTPQPCWHCHHVHVPNTHYSQ